jgi:predicted lipoprotein with Yx(FWY)xxD motif
VTVARTQTGAIFITAQGKSLYIRDGNGCTDRCLSIWVPLFARGGDAGPPGWSIVRRKDGGYQWAYKSLPLYTCSKDAAPGEVTCNGLGNGAFHVARP